MSLFESQLLRLKECLGLREDQEVANALGMTKAAFSYRKRTGSFPEERLVTLKAKRPDLDLQYILFGERWDEKAREAHDDFANAAVEMGLAPSAAASAIAKGLLRVRADNLTALTHPLVRSLIETLHWCDDDALDLLVRVAARLRGPERIPIGDRETAKQARAQRAHEGADLDVVAGTGTLRKKKR